MKAWMKAREMEWGRVKKKKKEEVEKKRTHYYRYRDTWSRVLIPCSCLFCCMYVTGSDSILPDSETVLKPAPLYARISQEWALVTPVAKSGVYSGPETGFWYRI